MVYGSHCAEDAYGKGCIGQHAHNTRGGNTCLAEVETEEDQQSGTAPASSVSAKQEAAIG